MSDSSVRLSAGERGVVPERGVVDDHTEGGHTDECFQNNRGSAPWEKYSAVIGRYCGVLPRTDRQSGTAGEITTTVGAL